MNPVFRDGPITDLNEIPVSTRLASIIKEAETKEWEILFTHIRLSLANRIGTAEDSAALLTLQGKIKGIEEISSFFQKIISKKA